MDTVNLQFSRAESKVLHSLMPHHLISEALQKDESNYLPAMLNSVMLFLQQVWGNGTKLPEGSKDNMQSTAISLPQDVSSSAGMPHISISFVFLLGNCFLNHANCC